MSPEPEEVPVPAALLEGLELADDWVLHVVADAICLHEELEACAWCVRAASRALEAAGEVGWGLLPLCGATIEERAEWSGLGEPINARIICDTPLPCPRHP